MSLDNQHERDSEIDTFGPICSKLSCLCGITYPVTSECARSIFVDFCNAIHDNLPLLTRAGHHRFSAHPFLLGSILLVFTLVLQIVTPCCNAQWIIRRKCLCVQLETLDKIFVLAVSFDAMNLA